MKHIYRMYRFVKSNKSLINKHNEEHDTDLIAKTLHYKPLMIGVVQDFAKREGISFKEADLIRQNAENRGYLLVNRSNTDLTITSAPSEKGNQLIDDVWGVPLGLCQEIWGIYGTLISFLTGAFCITLVLAFWNLLRNLVERLL